MSEPEPPFTFRPIPPPGAAPEHPDAAQYGVLSCLRVEQDEDAFRCRRCGRMQPPGSPMVMVTAGIRIGDPVWSIEEMSRQSAWNGQFSAWCVECARRLGGEKPARPWWRRWWPS